MTSWTRLHLGVCTGVSRVRLVLIEYNSNRECEYVPTNIAKVVHAGLVVSQALREPAGVSSH